MSSPSHCHTCGNLCVSLQLGLLASPDLTHSLTHFVWLSCVCACACVFMCKREHDGGIQHRSLQDHVLSPLTSLASCCVPHRQMLQHRIDEIADAFEQDLAIEDADRELDASNFEDEGAEDGVIVNSDVSWPYFFCPLALFFYLLLALMPAPIIAFVCRMTMMQRMRRKRMKMLWTQRSSSRQSVGTMATARL